MMWITGGQNGDGISSTGYAVFIPAKTASDEQDMIDNYINNNNDLRDLSSACAGPCHYNSL